VTCRLQHPVLGSPTGGPGQITIIDFPQVVYLHSNPKAQFILRRDIERTLRVLSGQGVRCNPRPSPTRCGTATRKRQIPKTGGGLVRGWWKRSVRYHSGGERNVNQKNRKKNGNIVIAGAPAIPALPFAVSRQADFPAMVPVESPASRRVDQIERTESVEEVALQYRHLSTRMRRRTCCSSRSTAMWWLWPVWWEQEENGRALRTLCQLLPAWRGTGLRRTMLDYCEHRLREIAAGHPTQRPARSMRPGPPDTETDWESVLVEAGYQVVRYGLTMTADLREYPDCRCRRPGGPARPARPVPAGLGSGQRGLSRPLGASEEEWAEENYQHWMEHPNFQPTCGRWPGTATR